MFAQGLLIAGAAIFGLLGFIHLVYTFYSRKFEAWDAEVTEAMKGTSPRISRETSVWNAWIGFNASHSIGAMLLALVYIPLAVAHFELIRQSLWFSLLPLLLGLAYLILARFYWFKIPLLGISLATSCFAISAMLMHG